jgi:hypothetical protein
MYHCGVQSFVTRAFLETQQILGEIQVSLEIFQTYFLIYFDVHICESMLQFCLDFKISRLIY